MSKTLKTGLASLILALSIGPTIALGATLDVDALITKYADKYSVSSSTMTAVVKCESYFDPLAVGDSGDSLGLVQIDLKYHPDVSRSQAFDPDYALNFLAYYLSIGKGSLWSCFRESK